MAVFASGLAAFVRPATGEVISVAVINWGTAIGAACFSVAGLAQLFERPDSSGSPPGSPRGTSRRAGPGSASTATGPGHS